LVEPRGSRTHRQFAANTVISDMETYQTIYNRAAHRHGGETALHEKLTQRQIPDSDQNISAPKSDSRWLAEFTRRIFQSGFNWKVVDAKWDGFETAFWNFDIARCARIDMDDMERLTANKAIVRNPIKIKTVSKNAEMIKTMQADAGSADKFIRGWAQDNYIGLLDYLQKNGSHLGTNTASYALRFSGIPSFILSKDVTAALIHAGVIDKPATSKTAKRAVQNAFNDWRMQSGKNLSYISRVLAHSIEG